MDYPFSGVRYSRTGFKGVFQLVSQDAAEVYRINLDRNMEIGYIGKLNLFDLGLC